MTSQISSLVIRWNEETRREEYWTGASWTVNAGQAALLSDAEAKRTAASVGGKAEDAGRILGDDDGE